MKRKRLLFGSTGIAAAVAVGIGAVAVTSSGSSLASNTVPTSQVASTPSSSTNNSTSSPAPRPHRRFFGMGRAVYSSSVVPKQGGGYETIIEVRGKLSAISSSSITVIRPDTGADVTAPITSATRFGNTTEAALASDLSSNTAVTVRVVEIANDVVSVSVPPPPGTQPKPGNGWFRGTFPPPNRPTSNSSTSA